jgi:integrase
MPPERLLDQVTTVARLKHYSIRTEQAYRSWIKRFILFHNKRHPSDMGEAEIRQFLSHLAVNLCVTSSTQTVALSALLFLYRDVLKQQLPFVDNIERAKPSRRLPVVFSREEAEAILAHLSGPYLLVASLLYGAGLRVMEALRLRVKDLDFDNNEITVRAGKGDKDRVTVLPQSLKYSLDRTTAQNESTSSKRSERRVWSRLSSLCPRSQISECERRLGLAVRVCRDQEIYRSQIRPRAASPYRARRSAGSCEESS